MKLSCLPVSLFQENPPLADWARLAKELGLDGFDLSVLQLRNRATDFPHELPIVMVTTYPDFTHPDAGQRARELEQLRGDIKLASKIGAKYLRITAGQAHPGVDGVRWVVDAFRQAREFAGDLTLVFENHSKPGVWQYADFSQPTEIFLKIAKETGIAINFDTANTLVYGDDPLPVLREVIDQVVTVHVADTAQRGRLEPVVIGTGAAPIRAVFELLQARGFDGWVCIEEASRTGRAGFEQAVKYVRETWRNCHGN
jgi:sugar phosphate isomerase/epimerase